MLADIYCADQCSKIFTFIYSFNFYNSSVHQELFEVHLKIELKESQRKEWLNNSLKVLQ